MISVVFISCLNFDFLICVSLKAAYRCNKTYESLIEYSLSLSSLAIADLTLPGGVIPLLKWACSPRKIGCSPNSSSLLEDYSVAVNLEVYVCVCSSIALSLWSAKSLSLYVFIFLMPWFPLSTYISMTDDLMEKVSSSSSWDSCRSFWSSLSSLTIT